MNMVVTAEGVETGEQAALLSSYGCAEAQGFFYCRPVPAEDINDLIGATQAALQPELPNAAQ
jgi:EAL domain-containing protein (putative c-di-GMP-specific phosphodiesterase class I)